MPLRCGARDCVGAARPADAEHAVNHAEARLLDRDLNLLEIEIACTCGRRG